MEIEIQTVSWAKANWDRLYGWDKYSKTPVVESDKTLCGKEIPEYRCKRAGHKVDFGSFTFKGWNAEEEHCLRCVQNAKNKFENNIEVA